MTLRKDRKLETIKLSSEYRNEILTSIFKFHKEFAEKVKPIQVNIGHFYGLIDHRCMSYSGI